MSACKTWKYVGVIAHGEADIDLVRQKVVEVDPDARIERSDALNAHLVLTDVGDAAFWARMIGDAEIHKRPAQ